MCHASYLMPSTRFPDSIHTCYLYVALRFLAPIRSYDKFTLRALHKLCMDSSVTGRNIPAPISVSVSTLADQSSLVARPVCCDIGVHLISVGSTHMRTGNVLGPGIHGPGCRPVYNHDRKNEHAGIHRVLAWSLKTTD